MLTLGLFIFQGLLTYVWFSQIVLNVPLFNLLALSIIEIDSIVHDNSLKHCPWYYIVSVCVQSGYLELKLRRIVK